MIKAQKYTSLYKGGTLKEHAEFLKEAKLQITGSKLGTANAAITGVKAKTQDSEVGKGALPPAPKGAKNEISGVKSKTVDSKLVTGERNTTQGKDFLGAGHGHLSPMNDEPKIKGETFNHHGEVPKLEAVKAKLKAKLEALKAKKTKIQEEHKVDDEVNNQEDLDFDPEDMGVGEDLSGLEAPVGGEEPAGGEASEKLADDLEQFVKDHEAELMKILGKEEGEAHEASETPAEESAEHEDEEEVETLPVEDEEETKED